MAKNKRHIPTINPLHEVRKVESKEKLVKLTKVLMTPDYDLCKCGKDRKVEGATCPFDEEIYGVTKECNCCDSCARDCARDI